MELALRELERQTAGAIRSFTVVTNLEAPLSPLCLTPTGKEAHTVRGRGGEPLPFSRSEGEESKREMERVGEAAKQDADCNKRCHTQQDRARCHTGGALLCASYVCRRRRGRREKERV